MTPPIFQLVAASPAVTAILGTRPTRFYPFNLAPQPGTDFYDVPYAVWQIVSGSPLNYLACRPDIDQYTIQIDIYAPRIADVRALTIAIRDAIEPHAYIVRWGNESIDPDTMLARYNLDIDFQNQRE